MCANVFKQAIHLSHKSMQGQTDSIEVMYNACYGGFNFSELVVEEYYKAKGILDFKDKKLPRSLHRIDRADPVMIEVVKRLGDKASGLCAKIKLIEVPRKFAAHYRLVEYDGYEGVEVDLETYKFDSIRAVLDDETVKDKLALAERIRDILDEKRTYIADWEGRAPVLTDQEAPKEVLVY